MEIGKTLYITDSEKWRTWLAENYDKEKGIWLVYPKKASGKPRISYNDAVEEALCFGWIDSIVKKLDEEQSVQRFSPRNPKSSYSQANKERLKALVKQGKVIPSVRKTLNPVLEENFTIAEDILNEVRSNKEAWENFNRYSEPYKRIRTAFIEAARNRPQEFKKRLNHFLKMTARNKQFGFGGIEKYY